MKPNQYDGQRWFRPNGEHCPIVSPVFGRPCSRPKGHEGPCEGGGSTWYEGRNEYATRPWGENEE